MIIRSTINDFVSQVVLPLIFTLGIGAILYNGITGRGDRSLLHDSMEAAVASRIVE